MAPLTDQRRKTAEHHLELPGHRAMGDVGAPQLLLCPDPRHCWQPKHKVRGRRGGKSRKGLNSPCNFNPKSQLNTLTTKRAQNSRRPWATGSRNESSSSAAATSPRSRMVPAKNEALGALAGISPRLSGQGKRHPQKYQTKAEQQEAAQGRERRPLLFFHLW